MTRRLLLSYLTVTLFVLIILELPLAVFFQQREFDRLTADVERDATVLATIYEDFLELGTPANSDSAAQYAASTGSRVVVVDALGISIVDTGADSDRDFSTRPEFGLALTGDRASGVRHSETLDADLLYVAVPVASGGTIHGAVRVTLDPHEVSERVHKFWWGLGGVALVVLTVVTAIGWALARSITQPVRRLEATAARFASGDLQPTVPDPRTPQEVAALEQAMNTMAGRLDRLLAQQREFVADASHQLRTPLTAMRLRLENVRADLQRADQIKDLDAATAEIDRLSTLVNDLLHLARAERPAPMEVVDLVQLTSERVDTWTAVAEGAGIGLHLDATDQRCAVLAIPGTIEQMLDNVLDNAVRATAPVGNISLSILTSSTSATLTIVDTGGGIEDAQLDKATDRFWRAEQNTPGTGLGLPIVKSLVEASGGTLAVTNALVNGSRVGLSVSMTFNRVKID